MRDQHNITVYYINATKIAQEIGLGNRTNTILQSAFFRITEVIPVDLAIEQMKKFIVKSYGKKGQDVVDKNYAAVDRGTLVALYTVFLFPFGNESGHTALLVLGCALLPCAVGFCKCRYREEVAVLSVDGAYYLVYEFGVVVGHFRIVGEL